MKQPIFRFDRPEDAHNLLFLQHCMNTIRSNFERVIVIKYGGSSMTNTSIKKNVVSDIAQLNRLGMSPIVIHGGGPLITKELTLHGKQTQFIEGLRVTDQETMDITEMVLSGAINKEIIGLFHLEEEVQAVGISGKDSSLLCAKKKELSSGDLGFVGDITSVNPDILHSLLDHNYIPVISPTAIGDNGESFNVNADTAASRIAASMQATKLIFLTDVNGILDENGETIEKISAQEIEKLIKKGIISGGMLPKIEGMLYALELGIEKILIINGMTPHGILGALFGDSFSGTLLFSGP